MNSSTRFSRQRDDKMNFTGNFSRGFSQIKIGMRGLRPWLSFSTYRLLPRPGKSINTSNLTKFVPTPWDNYACASTFNKLAAVSLAVSSKLLHLRWKTSSASFVSNLGSVNVDPSSLFSPIREDRFSSGSFRSASANWLKSTACPTTKRLFAAPGVVRARIWS